MKKILSYATACIAAVAIFAGCSEERADGLAAGKGKLKLTVQFDGDTPTRSAEPEDCVIRISNSQGDIYVFDSAAEIPAELTLLSGEYTVTAEAGTRENSGFETPFVYYYRGSETFSVTRGGTASVNLVCAVLNNIFTVAFDAAVADDLTDYSFTLYPDTGDPQYGLVFDESNPGAETCVMLEGGQTTVDWTFRAGHGILGQISKTGRLEGLVQGKRYELTVKHTIHKGQLELSVTVDESTVDRDHEITIYQNPVITADGFDIGVIQPADQAYDIIAAASSEITNIVLSGSVFGAGYDLLAPGNDPATQYGISLERIADEKIKVTVGMPLFEQMSGITNDIDITVTDLNGHSSSIVFSLTASGSGAESVRRVDIWATHATVTGVIESDDVQAAQFAYRPVGETEWSYIVGNSLGSNAYNARITGLTPGSSYELYIVADGTFKGSPVTFTTETANQPDNAGFENWYQKPKSGLPPLSGYNAHWFPYLQGQPYWDTGNPGAAKATSTPLTQSSTDVRPGTTGSKSAYLKSMKATVLGIGKFAAGNIFVGEFLEVSTSTMTGKVSFGRPFISRPSGLKGWYKAKPGVVNEVENGAPIANGAPDQYQIYICLTDKATPYTVDTNNKNSLMKLDSDPDSGDYDPNIIAFGQISDLLDVTQAVENWTEFTIPLKYRDTSRIPTYICIVVSASRFGDYFSGSTSSWMYVDDFELIYDDNVVLQD